MSQVNVVHKSIKEKDTLSHDYENKLDKLVRFYFDLEAIGVNDSPRVNAADQRALEILNRTCKYQNGYWEVGLLW